MAFALLTVSYQTIKAATADPVKSLKYEWPDGADSPYLSETPSF